MKSKGSYYTEKRNHRRMALNNCHMTYQLKGDRLEGKGIVKNLSGDGLLMMSERKLTVGDKLTLVVKPQKSLTAPLEAQVEVIWVEVLDSNCYRAGAKITEVLDKQQKS